MARCTDETAKNTHTNHTQKHTMNNNKLLGTFNSLQKAVDFQQVSVVKDSGYSYGVEDCFDGTWEVWAYASNLDYDVY